jgi:hypothetical protein
MIANLMVFGIILLVGLAGFVMSVLYVGSLWELVDEELCSDYERLKYGVIWKMTYRHVHKGTIKIIYK